MLLLSYHRRLRTISEALELRVVGGRASYSWCMCVFIHSYDGLCGGRDGGGGLYVCGTKPSGLVSCREMPEHFKSAS